MAIRIESKGSWDNINQNNYGGEQVVVPSDKEGCVILAWHVYDYRGNGVFKWYGDDAIVDLTELEQVRAGNYNFGCSHIYDPEAGDFTFESYTPGSVNLYQSGAWIVLSGVRNASHTYTNGEGTATYAEATKSPGVDGILAVFGVGEIVTASNSSLRSGSLIGLCNTNVSGHRIHGGAAYIRGQGSGSPVTCGINYPGTGSQAPASSLFYEPMYKGGEGIPTFF